ncbi:MAG: NAD-dependent epimerase/dehydratase family protein [Candidatus Omnitrophica bacterium]|nr:NAD-dependent epimerase/dehydratase family protein [Candidatus Omnitrophota bacterium]
MNNLQNSRICVTGGAGFVGSYLLEQLLQEGAQEIIVLDNLFRGSKENIAGSLASGKVKLIAGDIRELKTLDECLTGIDYCFHLAALRITHCAEHPREALTTMYDGSFNVLEGCVKHKVKRLVLASSASIYGQADEFPTKETHHPYNNRTLYGAAKMADELMCRSFHAMYGLQFNALRYFNIYGPRMDTFGKYTEVFIRWYHLIKEGKEPLIYGDGKQTMDFIYVGEVARATILAMKSDAANDVFNIASGMETSLEQLACAILKAMNSPLKPKYIPLPDERKKVEVARRLADVSKAREMFGFKSQVDLIDGLKRLVQWLDETVKK